jgi:hypothetical protein
LKYWFIKEKNKIIRMNDLSTYDSEYKPIEKQKSRCYSFLGEKKRFKYLEFGSDHRMGLLQNLVYDFFVLKEEWHSSTTLSYFMI